MPVRSDLNKGRVVTGMLILLAVSPISSRAFAQSDSDPKWDFSWSLDINGCIPPAPPRAFGSPGCHLFRAAEGSHSG